MASRTERPLLLALVALSTCFTAAGLAGIIYIASHQPKNQVVLAPSFRGVALNHQIREIASRIKVMKCSVASGVKTCGVDITQYAGLELAGPPSLTFDQADRMKSFGVVLKSRDDFPYLIKALDQEYAGVKAETRTDDVQGFVARSWQFPFGMKCLAVVTSKTAAYICGAAGELGANGEMSPVDYKGDPSDL